MKGENTVRVVSRGVVEHELKCWPGPFAGLVSQEKKHEVRANDRDYRVGDVLILREWHPFECRYTGRKETRLVTWISKGPDWGLPVGVVVMSVEPV